MAKIIAVTNQKGGVGKTTSVINLGAALAELGKKVLLLDMDPQGNLGISLGVDLGTNKRTIYQVLLEEKVKMVDAIRETGVKGMEMVPADRDLAAGRVNLVNREKELSKAIKSVIKKYDYVLIDCPPSLDILTLSALVAADSVLIPLQCHYLALKGLNELYILILQVKKYYNSNLSIISVLPTMYASRTIHSREVLEEIKEVLGDKVFEIPVKQTIRFPESTIAGASILSFSANSDVADVYRALARRVVKDEQKTVA